MSSAQIRDRTRSLEFAQDVGVAEGVVDRIEPAIGQEVVVHDDACLQILEDRAALFIDAIEGEGQARRRMQPLQLAGDAKPRFVEMANLRLGHALADELVNLLQLLRLLSDPGDGAGRADQRRPEEIAQRLRGPILGDELLDIEIAISAGDTYEINRPTARVYRSSSGRSSSLIARQAAPSRGRRLAVLERP
jgi:hypothetical protein